MSTLFVVATPIGNLGDMSPRALEALRSVGLICAEDTRRTRALLSHFAIHGKEVRASHAHSSPRDLAFVIAALCEGRDVAVVTDAGTPIVSDPGESLIAAAVVEGHTIVPIPGASAVLTALVGAGLGGSGFRFLGFLPRDGIARAERLALVVQTPETVILFEAPNRTHKTLQELAELAPERTCVVARELTKMHEQFHRGTLATLAATEEAAWLGEIVLVIGPRTDTADDKPSDDALDLRIDEELAKGGHAKTIAERLAAWCGKPKREVYERVITRKNPLG
jgi:16S rRNA (cytidine1402-2'-O)-methyltransferase